MIKKLLILISIGCAFSFHITLIFSSIYSKKTVDYVSLQKIGGLVYFQNNSEPFTGKATSKYRNSRKIEHKYFFKNGILDSYIHYEIDGKILASGKRDNEKLNETLNFYYPNGKLKQEANYIDCKLISKKFYDENGKLKREKNFKDEDEDKLEIIK